MPDVSQIPNHSSLPVDDATDDLTSLDFTRPGALAAPEPVPAPEPSAPPPLLEQARALAAAGQAAQARALLETAITAGDAGQGDDAEAAWSLLLELLQTLRLRAAFEVRALAYATRFEKSPPAWVEADVPAPVAKRGQMVSASLSGTLNANVRGPLQKVLEVCRQAPVRIDLARITGADDAGCGLLLAALRACDKAGARCVLAGAGHVAALLAPQARSGARDNEHVWLLLLELRQRLGCQEAFEDLAVAYAVTFEVSPPSWEPALVGHCEN